MDNLSKNWQDAKQHIVVPAQITDQLIILATKKKKKIFFFHYGTILILTFTFTIISLYFYYATFNLLLSKIGITCMESGLMLRILIEVLSTLKFKKVELVNDVSKTTNDALAFYNFRKKIHGPITIATVGLYITGFYLLTPELSKYISLQWLILINSIFLVVAIFLIWQIRMGIRKEMKNLLHLTELKRDINE